MLTEKIFVILLASLVTAFNYRKFVSLNNQKFMTQPKPVNLDRCVGSCNTLDEIEYDTEDLKLHVFNMITGIKEWRTLTKHISYKCECKFDNKKCNSNQKWNNSKRHRECKNL